MVNCDLFFIFSYGLPESCIGQKESTLRYIIFLVIVKSLPAYFCREEILRIMKNKKKSDTTKITQFYKNRREKGAQN